MFYFFKVPKPTEKRLLFVYQTTFQKGLLQKYGNSICLLDATYKTTKYVVLLFFVAVKTNVDYQVVEFLGIQYEMTDAIAEVLSRLKSWNPRWQPRCFMIDYCDEEISAIRQNFPCKYVNVVLLKRGWGLRFNMFLLLQIILRTFCICIYLYYYVNMRWTYMLFHILIVTDCWIFLCNFHREQAWLRWLLHLTTIWEKTKRDVFTAWGK